MKQLFLNIKYFVLVKLGKLRCSGWKVYPNGVRCCGCGDCKKEVPNEKAESAVNSKICNTCKGNGEWVDVESREITICPDCNGTGIISKTCHTLKVNNKMEQVVMDDQITLEDWLNEEIEVCDKCLRACCWHGLFMCDDSTISGTIKKKRRDLVALGLEHSDYMVVDGESKHLYVTPKPQPVSCWRRLKTHR